MMKKIIDWLLMKKIKNIKGEMEARGISVTKVCAVVIGVMIGIEMASPYFGSPIVIDPKIYKLIASIGGIALRDGVAKSAPPEA